jgi:phosphatidate cytidylyltransferase
MLKQRVLTALVLIPLFLALLFKLSPYGFGVFTTVIVMLAAWEWSLLMGIKPFMVRLCYPVFVYGIAKAFAIIIMFLRVPIEYILLIGAAWWLLALILVMRYPNASERWGKSLVLRGVMGLFVLIPTWWALNYIRDTNLYGADNGTYALLFLFVLIWGADTGAYFAGKKWGKDKLAPKVSPGKTRQGLIGALCTTLLIAPFFYSVMPDAGPNLLAVIILCVITVLFSVLGDLFESMLKRNVDIKDSGRLIPGHGGLLDRIDSLTAAAPIFALGSWCVLKMFH